jgi:hypothetical protein
MPGRERLRALCRSVVDLCCSTCWAPVGQPRSIDMANSSW